MRTLINIPLNSAVTFTKISDILHFNFMDVIHNVSEFLTLASIQLM